MAPLISLRLIATIAGLSMPLALLPGHALASIGVNPAPSPENIADSPAERSMLSQKLGQLWDPWNGKGYTSSLGAAWTSLDWGGRWLIW